jgi:DNA-binding NtrC family response regulator
MSRFFLVKKTFTVMVADRNGNVRDFLRRELMAEGYVVWMAGDGHEVGKLMAPAIHSPDLLILDPDLPHQDGEFLARLQEYNPPLPVIVHSLTIERLTFPAVMHVAALVEKNGETDVLKEAVARTLHKSSSPNPTPEGEERRAAVGRSSGARPERKGKKG